MPDRNPHLAMREKPLLFKTPMVRAIIDRNKRQTRRLLKPQPEPLPDFIYPDGKPRMAWLWSSPKGRPVIIAGPRFQDLLDAINELPPACPLGAPGDRLWVREAWRYDELSSEFIYLADSPDPSPCKWKPSIFMPREACRLELEITSVRVEGIQNLSDDDAFAEGIYRHPSDSGWTWDGVGSFPRPCDAYWDLWDRINPDNLVTSDPIVWAIAFKRLEVSCEKEGTRP